MWQEDWPDWRPVTEIEGLTEMIYRVMHVSPPPPPQPKGTENIEILTKCIDEPSIKKIMDNHFFPPSEDSRSFTISEGEFISRGKKRFNKRLRVYIVSEQGEKFKTYSRDVSVGGIYLEDSVPEWVSGYFKARIAKPGNKQMIELTCCLIENQKPGESFRIAILPLQSTEDEKNLELWLAA
ncbi:MAG: hypothetical protein A2Z20_07500 [Bdellovibrionales bacterium RBG_16_40_8]|nr:MAG: hypothetical protein A2Z20_07500 [Bdellovibrionales bacterium RBG_16_40_8]